MITTKSLTALQRKAEFAKAAILNEMTMTAAARSLGFSIQHLLECFKGNRTPSEQAAAAVADFVGMPVEAFWGQSFDSQAHASS